jgi:SAM-dependent methyltransferase
MSGHHSHSGHERHPHHRDHGQALGGQDWAELGAHLELEADVLSPYLDEAVSLLRSLVPTASDAVLRIADLGCGPGTATMALARGFPQSSVVALDRAPALLARVSERARRLGVGDRVKVVEGDLESDLTALGPIDLAWVAMVLHHVADPVGVLRRIHASLRPGGLLAIAEFGPPTRTIPEDLGFGTPGFPRRHADVMAAALEAHLPAGALHIDWPANLRRAGFDLVDRRTVSVDLPAPLPEPARRWIREVLLRSAAQVEEHLPAHDQATLAVLVDPTDPRGVMNRNDVEVHAGRSLYVARKPGPSSSAGST